MLHVLPELESKIQPTPTLILQNEVFTLYGRPTVVIDDAEMQNDVMEKFRGMGNQR